MPTLQLQTVKFDRTLTWDRYVLNIEQEGEIGGSAIR